MNSGLLFLLHTLHFTAVDCRGCCRKRNEDFMKGGQGIFILRIIPSQNFFFSKDGFQKGCITAKWKLKWKLRKSDSRQIGNLPKNCVCSWTDTGNHMRNGFQSAIFLLKWHGRVILPVGEKVPYCSVSRETRPVLSVHSAVTLAIRWYNAVQCYAKCHLSLPMPHPHWQLTSDPLQDVCACIVYLLQVRRLR